MRVDKGTNMIRLDDVLDEHLEKQRLLDEHHDRIGNWLAAGGLVLFFAIFACLPW